MPEAGVEDIILTLIVGQQHQILLPMVVEGEVDLLVRDLVMEIQELMLPVVVAVVHPHHLQEVVLLEVEVVPVS